MKNKQNHSSLNYALIVLLTVTATATVSAETLQLRNGKKLTGTITVDKPDYYVIKTDDGRNMKIPKKWVTGGGPAGSATAAATPQAGGGLFGFLNFGNAMAQANATMAEAQSRQFEIQKMMLEMENSGYGDIMPPAGGAATQNGMPNMDALYESYQQEYTGSAESSGSSSGKKKRKSLLEESHENTMNSVGGYQ